MYGTQTDPFLSRCRRVFENDVKMYGTQTIRRAAEYTLQFENDVKMYGTQTGSLPGSPLLCLRMM